MRVTVFCPSVECTEVPRQHIYEPCEYGIDRKEQDGASFSLHYESKSFLVFSDVCLEAREDVFEIVIFAVFLQGRVVTLVALLADKLG